MQMLYVILISDFFYTLNCGARNQNIAVSWMTFDVYISESQFAYNKI